MEKQVALGSFVPDFPQTLSLCAIFALVQPFLRVELYRQFSSSSNAMDAWV